MLNIINITVINDYASSVRVSIIYLYESSFGFRIHLSNSSGRLLEAPRLKFVVEEGKLTVRRRVLPWIDSIFKI